MDNPNVTKPKYSVIMLIYHRTDDLLKMALECMDSVKKNSDDYEFIIVDNGSTERFPWELHCDTYIRFHQNYGVSRGWNAGILASRAQYKVIIGDDTLVSKDWLPKMAEAFKNESCGVVNPYVENLPVGIGIKEDYKWFSGACFMLTQKTIDKVGLFDQDAYFPTNWEDWDYWLRVYKAGLKCYKNFSAKVKHLEGQTTKAKDLNKGKDNTRRAFISKWGYDATPIFCGNENIPFS